MARNGDAMDARVWGNLQEYVALETIFAKLPFRKFFQLRLVCREWDRLAGDRTFLEAHFKDHLFPEPHFFLNSRSPWQWKSFLHGLLAFNETSGRWNWTRLHPLQDWQGSFTVEGLIYNEKVRVRMSREQRREIKLRFSLDDDPNEFEDHPRYEVALQDIRRRQSVFNVHTRVWYKLPPPLQRSTRFPLVGMIVETSVRPFHFKLIQGSSDLGTQIFDSKTNAWELRRSMLPAWLNSQMNRRRIGCRDVRHQSCVNVNGLLYIRSEIETILVYDISKDIWSTVREPPGDVESSCKCIGAWQGRLFGVRECTSPESIFVWELALNSSRWKRYNQMPAKLYQWLYYIQGDDFADVEIHATFSGQYLLVYAWLVQESVAEKFVLLDLATKAWKAHVPFGNLEVALSPPQRDLADEPSGDEYDDESTQPTDSPSGSEDESDEGYDDEESDEFEYEEEESEEEEVLPLP